MNLSHRQISMVITAVENTVREWERTESNIALPATLVAEQVAEWT